MKITIKHVDGVTDVKAKVFVCDSYTVSLDYKHEGMSYSVSMELPEAIKKGIIKKVKSRSDFRELVKGEIYPIVNTEIINWGQTTGDMSITTPKGSCHYSQFYPAI